MCIPCQAQPERVHHGADQPSRTVLPGRSARRLAPLLAALSMAVALAVALAPAAAQTAPDAFALRLGSERATLSQNGAGLWLARGGDQAASVALPAGFASAGFELDDAASTVDHWLAAGVDRSGARPRLAVFRGAGSRLTAIAAPETTGSELMTPRLVAGDAGLRYLIWLEGDRFDALAVHAARFSGGRLQAAEVVAPPGPGTQIALTAALLADDSVLIAWAGYDGEDDEIWWSRSTRNGWSAPARAHDDDRVPDITPSLVATDAGALLAWSAYDGNDYRVMTARFAGGAFDPPRTIGEKGSVFPTFAAHTSLPLVLYKTALPRTWTVQALDASGRPHAKAQMALDPAAAMGNARPMVEQAGGTVTLRWPGAGAPPSAKLALTAVAGE